MPASKDNTIKSNPAISLYSQKAKLLTFISRRGTKAGREIILTAAISTILHPVVTILVPSVVFKLIPDI
jgi:hypothetical protein